MKELTMASAGILEQGLGMVPRTAAFASLLATACNFQRSTEVPRSQAERLGARVTIANTAGETREARVTKVQPLGARSELRSLHPEHPGQPPATREVVRASWNRDPTWDRARVDLSVEEAPGTWVVVGGAIVGAVVLSGAASLAMSCEPSATRSCEDAGTIRAGAIVFAVPVGALVGALAGGGLHQLLGDDRYRIVGDGQHPSTAPVHPFGARSNSR